nr:homocysteine S-methyltransferase family protein [Parablautia sp. Marseille-Q6255]
MTKQGFKELVQQGTVLLDGATGSNLRNAGMPVGICAEQWILEHPEVMKELQRAYVEAGSQILYAPTFSGNRISLALHGLQERLTGLNTKLVELSQEASGGRAYVAGDMTTTGKLLEPRGDISYQELYEVYQEQARVLISAGVDLIVAETMMNVDETVVLLDAVQSVAQIPVMCTLTVEADGSALYGGSAVEAVETLQEMGADAVGINCSVGPDQLEAVVASMYRAARIPVIAKPNAGIPVMDEHGQAHYSMGPEQFAVSMKRLVENGARIVGGCCGTTPEYISLLAQTLRR